MTDMLGRVTFEEFAARNGASAQGFGDAGNHRRGERHSDKTWARVLQVQHDKDAELYSKRAELRKLYTAKVIAGEIVPPTNRERIIAIAGGHPDLPSTQAARRIVERRYGGVGLGGDTPLPASAPTDATSRSGQHDAPGILES